jgi:hypothetical protein
MSLHKGKGRFQRSPDKALFEAAAEGRKLLHL